MADVDQQIRARGCALQQACDTAGFRLAFVNVHARGGAEEVRYRLLDLTSAIGVRNEQRILAAMLKNAARQNTSIRILYNEHFFPIGTLA